MESQTTINLPEKTSNNKDLPKKKVNRKKNNKETRKQDRKANTFF